jgi:hypothetical protein
LLGCSPDGMVTCKCPVDHAKEWLLEVKCPYSLRDMEPKEAALLCGCLENNNTLSLSPMHEYNVQIQGQMWVTGLKTCDLVVYTKRGIYSINVAYDEYFFLNVRNNLQYFCRNYLFAHLLTLIDSE